MLVPKNKRPSKQRFAFNDRFETEDCQLIQEVGKKKDRESKNQERERERERETTRKKILSPTGNQRPVSLRKAFKSLQLTPGWT
jgi:hypothetical protein